MIKLDLQSRQPIYEQLKTKLCELVMLGELKPDDQLPSVRNFARELGVNPNTVQKAYQDLERDGIIYSVAGRGSYISDAKSVNSQLREQSLGRVRHAVKQAKASGIEESGVVDTVRQVYKEGKTND